MELMIQLKECSFPKNCVNHLPLHQHHQHQHRLYRQFEIGTIVEFVVGSVVAVAQIEFWIPHICLLRAKTGHHNWTKGMAMVRRMGTAPGLARACWLVEAAQVDLEGWVDRTNLGSPMGNTAGNQGLALDHLS